MTRQYSLVKADAFNALNSRLVPDIAALLASEDGYLTDDVITTFEGGHCYRVVADEEDLITAGGTKLKVLAGAGKTLTPEQFGADGSGQTVCTAEFQRFLDAVISSKGRGIAAGLYRIDDTVCVNTDFVDGVHDAAGDASNFFLSIGQSEGEATGLYYVGDGGTGENPDEVKPAISFHNVDRFTLGNVCVTNELGAEKRFSCGIRWTGSNDRQRGNAMIGLLHVQGFERGIVIGLDEHFPDSDMNILENVDIAKIRVSQCRYPLYMSCPASKNWTVGHLLSKAYDVSPRGPAFHRDDLGGDRASTMSGCIVDIAEAGFGTISAMELAQHDMLADGTGAAIRFETVRILGGSLDLSNCYAFRQVAASSAGTPTVLHDLWTNKDCHGESGRAAWFLGNVRLMNSTLAGTIRTLDRVDLINPAFYSDVDPATLDIESTFFDPYGGVDFRDFIILNLCCHDSSNALWPGYSYSQIPNLTTSTPTSLANLAVANSTTEQATVRAVAQYETVELSYSAEIGETLVSAGRILLSRPSVSGGWATINPLTENSEVTITIDKTDVAGGTFTILVTNTTGAELQFVAFETYRGIRA